MHSLRPNVSLQNNQGKFGIPQTLLRPRAANFPISVLPTQALPSPRWPHVRGLTTSLNRTRNSGLSWPGLWHMVHHHSPGQAIPLLRSG
jgi:hypothetical protein